MRMKSTPRFGAHFYIEKIKRLIEANQLDRAEKVALASLHFFEKEARLWRLLGMIDGLCERHYEAQRAFVEAYELDHEDVDLCNAITSFFAIGDAKTAVSMIEESFSSFNNEAKRVIAMSVLEAINTQIVSWASVPLEVQVYMKKVRAGVV